MTRNTRSTPMTEQAAHIAEPATRREFALIMALIAAIAGLATLHSPIADPIVDLFHEGEYLSSRLLLANPAHPPLLIHGFMDYLVAFIAGDVFGPDRLIAGTRLFNLLAAWGGGIAFLGTLQCLARSRNERFAALIVGGALMIWIDGRVHGVLGIQQGTPGTRDIGLNIMVWLLCAACRRNGVRVNIFGLLAGVVAGLSTFWAYNRGFAGLAGLGAYAVTALFCGRNLRHICWLAGGFALGLLVVSILDPVPLFSHIANIVYWQKHGDIWALDHASIYFLMRYGPFYLLVTAVILFGLYRAKTWRRSDEARQRVPAIVLCVAVLAVLAKIGLGTPSPLHLMTLVPWIALSLFAMWPARLDPSAAWRKLFAAHRVPLALGGALLICDVSAETGISFFRPILIGVGHNMRVLVKGLPKDNALESPQVKGVISMLRKGQGTCTYVFDNSGAFYHMSGLRACSPIMLPVYAEGNMEQRLLSDLATANPPLVIGRSTEWNDSIFGRSLAQRTPLINAWLNSRYVVAASIGGVEIWHRRDAILK